MISEKALQELAAFEPTGFPVVSLYLNVDPTQRTTDAYKLRLRGLRKEVEQPGLSDDLQAIEKYIDHEYDWSGRALVVFSSQPTGFWHTFPLAVPLERSMVQVGPTPFIRPLVQLVDEYGSYGVVIVDRQGARLFEFNLGQLVESSGFLGEEVRRLKKGGGSSRGGASRSGGGGGARRERAAAAHNLRETAAVTAEFYKARQLKHLLIAGTDQVVAQFHELLPKHIQEAVVGEFSIDMSASQLDVLEKSLDIVQQADQARQVSLVEAVITAAAKGSNGVIRLDDTLGAVSEGRVQTLVVSDGFHAPGYRCQSCTYITAQALSACPFCGGQVSEIPDAVELAIKRVTEHGGGVEIVEQKAQLDGAGSISALLRY